MPNRNARNDADKYDHSSHSILRPEKGDMQATPAGKPGDQSLADPAIEESRSEDSTLPRDSRPKPRA